MKPPDVLFREHLADALKSVASAQDTLQAHGSKGMRDLFNPSLEETIRLLELLDDAAKGRTIT